MGKSHTHPKKPTSLTLRSYSGDREDPNVDSEEEKKIKQVQAKPQRSKCKLEKAQ